MGTSIHTNKKRISAYALILFALLITVMMTLSACNGGETTEPGLSTLRVGAAPAPHAEILHYVVPAMLEKGIQLEVVEYTDFLVPNTALDAGDIDANFFQHMPYLETFNEENGTDLSPVTGVHFEPLGIYPGRLSSFENIPEDAQLAIPSDPTNGARALNLLEREGLITLDPGAGLAATPRDITDNPYNVHIVEVEAPQLPRILPDVDFAVINGNYALESGIDFADALAIEDRNSPAAQRYTNYLVARANMVNDDYIQALAEVLNSNAVRSFIETRYHGRVVPTF